MEQSFLADIDRSTVERGKTTASLGGVGHGERLLHVCIACLFKREERICQVGVFYIFFALFLNLLGVAGEVITVLGVSRSQAFIFFYDLCRTILGQRELPGFYANILR